MSDGNKERSSTKLSPSISRKITFFLTILIIFSITVFTLSHAFETVEADGVGVEDVEPMISRVNIENQDGDYNLTLGILDFNSWKAINMTAIELYRGDNLRRRYVFEQDEDLNREFRAEKGPDLTYYQVRDNLTPGDGARDRCEMELTFHFPGGNHDSMKIIVEDHSDNRVESNIGLKSIDSGGEMSIIVVPVALVLTGIVLYKIRQDGSTRMYKG